ncbi:EAL domain-containing protein [Sulfurimonas sp. HSL3-7]|uniref:EAL domain-containing protein n=1 Tax=Sulfonitrofixus jiaomeiensis TaxID=3131938 RepID=UPI0031FA2DC8
MQLHDLGITHFDIYFQPIVTIKQKSVFGYEALVRAYNNTSYIAPHTLFSKAKKLGISAELDELIRLESIKSFKTYLDENPRTLLFLNIEPSFIDTFQPIEQNFENSLRQLNIPAENIVLEIKEEAITSNDALAAFTAYYKERGFNIAIDDFGTGQSQFERLSIVKPDIVKIDKTLLRDIDTHYINAEIVKAIARVCYNIGALVISEGVERQSEVLKSLNLDIDLFQGYWFSHPAAKTMDKETLVNKIETIGLQYKEQRKSLICFKENLFNDASVIAKKLIALIKSIKSIDDVQIFNAAKNEKKIEALYLIDAESSRQLGDTLLVGNKKKFYAPSLDGEDHSLKEYCYICSSSQNGCYLSPRYISNASGNLCRTFSKKFICNARELILCLDLHLE